MSGHGVDPCDALRGGNRGCSLVQADVRPVRRIGDMIICCRTRYCVIPYVNAKGAHQMISDVILGAAAALSAIGIVASGSVAAAAEKGTASMKVRATAVKRFEVYHSPQKPGYTCWVGAWSMPDESLMLSFHQATGPVAGRPHARPEVLERLTWPPLGGTAFGYDMTGLHQEVLYLASSDGGESWEEVASYPYHSPMNGISKGPVATADGTVVREVFGHYLPYWDVPQTGFVQRSTDRCRTWGPPLTIMDPGQYMTWPGRLRRLRDGRLVLVGAYAKRPGGAMTRAKWQKHMTLAAWFSKEGGKTWSLPVDVLRPGTGNDNETDCAELPDGQLLFISRVDRPHPPHKARCWQSIIAPADESFRLVSCEPAPFPHSGYPDLLAVQEGIVLYLATTGIHWTADAGQTWHDLGIGGSRYYPRSVQLPDGLIFSVGHRGGDNPFDGSVDQAVEALTFRLEVEPGK